MKSNHGYDYKMPEAEMNIAISAELPKHPGEVFIKFLKKAKLDEEPSNKIAKILGVSRTAYYDFINEENGISPDMALRLARFFFDFDPDEYPYAGDPYFWWDLSNKWLFVNSIKTPKKSLKRNAIGLIRYIVRDNKIGETNDSHRSLSITKEISLSFKEIIE